jgi:hypothetical protein
VARRLLTLSLLLITLLVGPSLWLWVRMDVAEAQSQTAIACVGFQTAADQMVGLPANSLVVAAETVPDESGAVRHRRAVKCAR